MEPITSKRLAFIKYLFKQGIEQSSRPEPLCCTALFSFHDAVELFLQLSSELLNVRSDRTRFMDYWDLISEKLPRNQELPQRESMRRLNKARVALKHHGNFPSRLDIDSYLLSSKNFFEEATSLVFNLSFSEISLANYVQPASAKSRVLGAETLIKENKLEPAIDNLAIAFLEILGDYEDSRSGGYRRSPFFFGESLSFLSSSSMGLKTRNSPFGVKFPQFVDKVKDSIEEIQKAIKILALRIDYRRYAKFKSLTPLIHHTMDGNYHVVRNDWYPSYEATKNDAEFCFDFIIEMSITLQEFDYRLARNA